MSLNKAQIIGRLGKDPELRYTQSGRATTSFDLATDSVWKDREGQRQKHTEWHKVVVWGPQAEACAKYLAKGRQVYVEGEIRTRSYDDRDGVKRYVTEIVARDVRFLGGGDGGSRRDDDREEPRSLSAEDALPSDDDLPF